MAGRVFEQLPVGLVIEHPIRPTISQRENLAFCDLTHNAQPLHRDEQWAAAHSPFGRVVVNGLLTMAMAVGVSVPQTTEGTLIANLGYDEVRHGAPVYPGDTIAVRSEVLSARRTSTPDRGLVVLRTVVTNQSGVEVCTFTRTMLVRVEHPSEVSP